MHTDAEQFTHELGLEGGMWRTRWVGGFYYLDIDITDANGAEISLQGIVAALAAPGLLCNDDAGNAIELDVQYTDGGLWCLSWNRGVKGGGLNAPFDRLKGLRRYLPSVRDLHTAAGPNLNENLRLSFKTTGVQTSERNVNSLLRYAWPICGGEVAVQGDFVYRSAHYFGIARSESSTEDGYIAGKAWLSYTTRDGDWEAAFFVKNIAVEDCFVLTFELSDDLGMTEQCYDRQRWIGGSIRYSWE